MKKLFKKINTSIIIGILAGFCLTLAFGVSAATYIRSRQLAPSPVDTYILATDGVDNAWVDPSTLSTGGGITDIGWSFSSNDSNLIINPASGTTDSEIVVDYVLSPDIVLGNASEEGSLSLYSLNGDPWTIKANPSPSVAFQSQTLYSWQTVPTDGYLVSVSVAGSEVTLTEVDPSTLAGVGEAFHWHNPSMMFGALPGDAFFSGTGEQGFGGNQIAVTSGTITSYGYYISNWTAAGTVDVIAVNLKINGATADSFNVTQPGSGFSAGWNSTTCSEVFSAGDEINVLIEKTTINLPEDNVTVRAASAG